METPDDQLLKFIPAGSYLLTEDSANEQTDCDTRPSSIRTQPTEEIHMGRSLIPTTISTAIRDIPKDIERPGPLRSIGRPRIGASGKAVLSEERRKQVRHAQRTYRLKKEARLQRLQARVSELEQRLERISVLSSGFRDAALDCNLDATHPELFSYFDRMRELMIINLETSSVANGDENVSQSNSSSTSRDGHLPNSIVRRSEETDKHHPRLERASLVTAQFTSCFQEQTFARKLHRYCLEYAYRLFIDASSNPKDIYRVFRLVPCIRDRSKMEPYFRRLVDGGIQESLEILTLPFYCIGGAGTHYPQRDENGIPIYPPNMRFPGRILGILPTASSEADSSVRRQSKEQNLALLGFGGGWFDCNDVMGYLAEIGVDVWSGDLMARIDLSRQIREVNQSYENVLDRMLLGDENMSRNDYDDIRRASRYVLDVEYFFSRLLQGAVILGRAPGFRKSDVEFALHSSLQMQTTI